LLKNISDVMAILKVDGHPHDEAAQKAAVILTKPASSWNAAEQAIFDRASGASG
jgi:hypothetical protein